MKWREVGRMPQRMSDHFLGRPSESFYCTGHGHLIFLTRDNCDMGLLFDLKQKAWQWVTGCPNLDGLAFEPRLDYRVWMHGIFVCWNRDILIQVSCISVQIFPRNLILDIFLIPKRHYHRDECLEGKDKPVCADQLGILQVCTKLTFILTVSHHWSVHKACPQQAILESSGP